MSDVGVLSYQWQIPMRNGVEISHHAWKRFDRVPNLACTRLPLISHQNFANFWCIRARFLHLFYVVCRACDDHLNKSQIAPRAPTKLVWGNVSLNGTHILVRVFHFACEFATFRWGSVLYWSRAPFRRGGALRTSIDSPSSLPTPIHFDMSSFTRVFKIFR